MPILKEKEINTSKLDVCRHCHGTGVIWQFIELVPCPVCDGRRVVRKTLNGVLKVESLPPEQDID